MSAKPATKPATRKQLIAWLANAIRHCPPNLCQMTPTFSMPPPWCKDALAELERNGITFTPPIFDDEP